MAEEITNDTERAEGEEIGSATKRSVLIVEGGGVR